MDGRPAAAVLDPALALVHHVGQLVGQQLFARRRVRRVLALPEKDVVPHGKSSGVHLAVEPVGLGVCVDVDAAHVASHGLAHLCLHRVFQRLARAALLLDPPGGLLIQRISGLSSAALGHQQLHSAVADLLL